MSASDCKLRQMLEPSSLAEARALLRVSARGLPLGGFRDLGPFGQGVGVLLDDLITLFSRCAAGQMPQVCRVQIALSSPLPARLLTILLAILCALLRPSSDWEEHVHQHAFDGQQRGEMVPLSTSNAALTPRCLSVSAQVGGCRARHGPSGRTPRRWCRPWCLVRAQTRFPLSKMRLNNVSITSLSLTH